MHRPAASLRRQLHAAASVAAQCVRSAAQLGTARPYKAASAFWHCAHRSPPDWAHTRPPLHRDQVHPPPTSATGLSRSLAHLCTAKESVPRPHLHRNRVHPPPTSAPPLLPSGSSASARQHACDAAQCVATTCTGLQPSATCARSPLRTRMLQPAARCRAALRLAASDPIQASGAFASASLSRLLRGGFD
jgi:hypothetical protein